MLPLSDRFPLLMRSLAPLPLATLPTPVKHISNLGKNLYLKQDNLTSPLYGGNKTRKLEFLLSEAKRKGVNTVVTMGGIGSNHLLATALHAQAQGIRTVGVVFPQPETESVRKNLLADRGAGVELVFIPSKYLLPAYVARTLLQIRRREGKKPLLIPGGGSSPLGVLGFINAALELAAQVEEGLLPEPESVFVPYGTGGTAAGLSLGLQLAGLKTKVVAVRVIDRLIANRPRLMMLLSSTAHCLTSQGDPTARPASIGKNLEIRRGYIGPGYGHPTKEAQRAVALFENEEGEKLEFTYTGKAAAAFLDEARSTTAPLLFWNTYSSADVSDWAKKGEQWH
jgi:D-cysteine desulfhydrase